MSRIACLLFFTCFVSCNHKTELIGLQFVKPCYEENRIKDSTRVSTSKYFSKASGMEKVCVLPLEVVSINRIQKDFSSSEDDYLLQEFKALDLGEIGDSLDEEITDYEIFFSLKEQAILSRLTDRATKDDPIFLFFLYNGIVVTKTFFWNRVDSNSIILKLNVDESHLIENALSAKYAE